MIIKRKERGMKDDGFVTAETLIVAFWLAVSTGKFAESKKLVKRGVFVDARDERGNSPLMVIAPNAKNNKIARLLLKAGAAVNGTNRNGETPLFLAAASGN
jgi:ankyrin repeat protein